MRYGQISDIEIIYEGDLMKYKPGIKHQYMSRWCQVTKSHFLYFSEGLPYASFLGKPLAVIPLDQIESVKRVYVEVPEKDEKYTRLKNFQFEIFLKRSGDKTSEGGNLQMYNDTKRWSHPKSVAPIISVQDYDRHGNGNEHDESYTSPLKENEIKKSSARKQQDGGTDPKNSQSKQQKQQFDRNSNNIQINVLGSSPAKGNRSNSIDQSTNQFKNNNVNRSPDNLLIVPGG